MESEVLVKVENVSKKFCRDLKRSLWYGVKDISSELFGAKKNGQLRPKEFWAVDDVSFELRRGECLGLIGHNGAGKSTLLKMLNGLIKPDKGRITMKGRIGALIELGAGFNPILTGRENIYNNGAVLGFSKKEIDAKFDAIVDFAEIGEFIDTPVQNYSSGMKVRLGFAVAAQMEPDVLIIDEVLAVGDLGFRIKCFNEIYKIIEKAAVILVSHSMPQVAQVCRTGMVMNNGKTLFEPGKVSDAIVCYYNLFGNDEVNTEGSHRGKIKGFKIGNGEQVLEYWAEESKTQPSIVFDHANYMFFEVTLQLDLGVRKFAMIISISDVDQKVVSQIKPSEELFVNDGQLMKLRARVDSLLLNTGNYTVSVHVYNDSNSVDRGEIVIGIRNIVKFSIKKDRFVGAAPILYESKWKLI